MVIRLDKEGVDGCLLRVNTAIETLNEAARTVDQAMSEIPNYWEGDAYNKARDTYDEEYKKLLTTTVPEAVENFRKYMDECKTKIIDIDKTLAGK